MKSLEIVNKELEDFEKALEDYKKRKAMLNEEADGEYIKQITEEIEKYQQIKQDLEVLEIIRKNTYRRDYNSLEPSITFIIPSWLGKEDFEKIKQWLEVNENE